MAEKEERIMIVADEPYYCNSCKKINNCSKDCKGYIEWFNRPDPIRHFYSKSEAIEKMAKSNWIATVCAKNQCVPVDITKEQWDEEWEKLRIYYKKVYYAGAEAALDALLEK